MHDIPTTPLKDFDKVAVKGIAYDFDDHTIICMFRECR